MAVHQYLYMEVRSTTWRGSRPPRVLNPSRNQACLSGATRNTQYASCNKTTCVFRTSIHVLQAYPRTPTSQVAGVSLKATMRSTGAVAFLVLGTNKSHST